MFEDLKKTWHRLREGEPGKRFQDYNRVHQAKRRGKASRVLTVAIGIAIVALGVVGLPAPGPGMLIIAIGGALIARESRAAARFLDWLELRLRALLGWARLVWKRASPVQRAAVAVAGFGVLGLAVYFAYSVTRRA